MLITGGSDAHRLEDVALSGVRSPFPVTSVDDYIHLLRSGQAEIMEEKTE